MMEKKIKTKNHFAHCGGSLKQPKKGAKKELLQFRSTFLSFKLRTKAYMINESRSTFDFCVNKGSVS